MKIETLVYQKEIIQFETAGSGKPIVLIHGFGEDASVWHNTTPILIPSFFVINIHLPGCGLNKNTDSRFCNINDCAQIILGILQSLLIEKATVIGHSMGGYIALQLAKIQPAIVPKLSLVHSTIYADDETKKTARQKNIDFIAEHGANLFLQQTIPNLFSTQYVTNNKVWLQAYIESLLYLSNETLINYTKAMMQRADSTDLIKTMHIPIQYFAGTDDKPVPFLTSLKQCYVGKISYFHKLNGVAHMGMIEAQDKVNVALIDFINKTH